MANVIIAWDLFDPASGNQVRPLQISGELVLPPELLGRVKAGEDSISAVEGDYAASGVVEATLFNIGVDIQLTAQAEAEAAAALAATNPPVTEAVVPPPEQP